MRILVPALLALLVLPVVPLATAEFGPLGVDGWPLAVDGTSTNPYPGLSAAELSAILDGQSGPPLNQVAGATIFPYWPLLTAEVLRLATDHPDRVRLVTAGKSTLGLDLYMLEIADFANLDAGTALPLAERETVWVDGGHHSNEYSGVYFTLAWAQYLVEQYGSDPTATWIVENRHTWILPMVNPDGSNLFGRLNANLVNVNRNYPVIWGEVAEDPVMNNPGPAPSSEVETRINIDWYNRTRPDYSASIHCCGNLWLYPYGREGLDPIDQPMLQKVCDEAFADVRQYCGPIWSTIYPASGSSVDTAYEWSGQVAFGYEMSGRGAISLWGQPITFDAVQSQEVESWQGLLHAFLNVHRYGALPNLTHVEGDGGALAVHVRNDGLGNLTSATLTLTDARGEARSATVPFLRPGDEAHVRVPGRGDGAYTLTVDYPKRLIATTNIGHQVHTVIVGDAADAAGADFAVSSLGSGERSSPTFGFALVVGLLAALAIFIRRR